MNGADPQDKEDGLESDILCSALDLCIAAMYVPEFAAYLSYYTGNIVTIQLAAEIEGIPYAGYSDTMRWLYKIRRVCWIDRKKIPLSFAAVEGDDVLLSYLSGDDRPDKIFSGKWNGSVVTMPWRPCLSGRIWHRKGRNGSGRHNPVQKY